MDTRLKCEALRVVYNFPNKTGRLVIRDDGCCDMSGAIELFAAIDPNVTLIETVNCNGRDTDYALTMDGWKAQAPAPGAE